jgi:hypothetical protein
MLVVGVVEVLVEELHPEVREEEELVDILPDIRLQPQEQQI